MNLDPFPKVGLAHLPTPLEKLRNLSDHLGGPQIWVKRDDCTGLAMGGNKTRKLEYALGEALAGGADTIINAGPMQSNCVRQTAAACNVLGLRCELVLSTFGAWCEPGYDHTANRLLLELLGAGLHFADTEWDRPQLMQSLSQDLKDAGRRPFILPAGASSPTGALGYAECAGELLDQAANLGITVDRVIVPAGSGGTQAGLIAGLQALGHPAKVTGIEIDAAPEHVLGWTQDCLRGVCNLLGMAPDPDRVQVINGYAGQAYGLPTPEMVEALRLVARLEGIILDPIYGGKAMAGLIDLIQRGTISPDETVVFVHTGGAPTLFAYTTALSQPQND